MAANATFHWLRVQTFCYATEDEELVHDTFAYMVGTEDFEVDIAEGEHGNRTIIMQHDMTKQKEFLALFERFPQDVLDGIVEDLDNRIDEDCFFYIRVDKQKAVQGVYEIAHHGDVVAVTGKVVSHPAKKEVAMRNARAFFSGITPSGVLPPQHPDPVQPSPRG